MRRSRREGYTLIELLVVIGIIGLLASIIIPAVAKVKDAAMRARVSSEIGELSLAVEGFKTTYDVKYIPSGLVLTNAYNPNNAAHVESQQFLSKIWPKGLASYSLPPAQDQISNQQINEFRLDGNQVLVFLLGGIPPGPDASKNEIFTYQVPPPGSYGYPLPPYFNGNRSGFRNSPAYPLNNPNGFVAVSGEQAKGPFFNFKQERLFGGHFYDPYGETPYLYFSSKNGNDYHAFGVFAGAINTYTQDGGWGRAADGNSVKPFKGLDGRYLNPNGFQIISAGKDKVFGRGGQYEPGIGDYTPSAPGGDDIANFHRGMLGADE